MCNCKCSCVKSEFKKGDKVWYVPQGVATTAGVGYMPVNKTLYKANVLGNISGMPIIEYEHSNGNVTLKYILAVNPTYLALQD